MKHTTLEKYRQASRNAMLSSKCWIEKVSKWQVLLLPSQTGQVLPFKTTELGSVILQTLNNDHMTGNFFEKLLSPIQSETPSWELLAFLRFILAAIVVSGHLLLFSDTATPWATFLDQFGGKAAVIGFLLISGFSIAASQQSNSHGFMGRRIYRIYPLYFFAIIFAMILEYSIRQIELPRTSIQTLGAPTAIGNLLLLQTFLVKPIQFNGPVWSLSIEFFFYACATQIPKISIKLLILAILISIASYLLPKRDDLGAIYFFFSKFNALKYLWCWLSGYIFWHHRSLGSTLLLLSGFAAVANSDITPGTLDPLTYIACVLLVAGSFKVKIKGLLSKIFVFLGDFSYPLYLFHFPAFIFTYAVLGIRDAESLMAAALAITAIFFVVVERFLKPKYLKKLFTPALKQ